MTGDGTKRPLRRWLAQTSVVAMNTGTQAAKEAGNMVDLDSDPTSSSRSSKSAKQLLMTRGALTTFSVANDLAKYFTILPAMLTGIAAFQVVKGDPHSSAFWSLNIMQLGTPSSAILSAVIFNALIIMALIPLALRGVKYRPMGRRAHPAPQPTRVRRWWRGPAFRRHQTDRRHRQRAPSRREAPMKMLRPCFVITLGLLFLCCLVYPGVVTAGAQVLFRDQANGSLVVKDGKVVGSALIGQSVADWAAHPEYLWGRASAASNDAATNITYSSGSNYGPLNGALLDEVKARVALLRGSGVTGPIPAEFGDKRAPAASTRISPRPRPTWQVRVSPALVRSAKPKCVS